MANKLVQKWVDENVNIAEIKQKIGERIENGSYGLNEDKTVRGMFLQTILTDSYTRWTNVELARHFGFITEEAKNYFYEHGLHDIDFGPQFKEFEKSICELLKEQSELSGKFVIKWAEPFQEKTENYLGICYQEQL